MIRSNTDDELFDIKNHFYIGNYQQCIIEAQNLRNIQNVEVALWRDIFIYRSYIAQKRYNVVLDEINDKSPDDLVPLRLLAEYMVRKDNRKAIIVELERQLSQAEPSEIMVLVAATLYILETSYESAYRILHAVDSLECSAMLVDVLLKMRRIDLAAKKVKEMQEKDDDATLSQLAHAWVNLATYGEDVYFTFHELIEKYTATPLLLNGEALALIDKDKLEEAESSLQEALVKDPNYPDTLINLIFVYTQMGKSYELCSRYLSQLRDSHPDHPFVVEYEQKKRDFAKIKEQYAPTHTMVTS